MSDLISRQAAIEAIGEKSDEIYKTKQKGATYPHDDFFQGMAYAESVVRKLPPAQPKSEERMPEPAQNVSDADLISRKAAIEAMLKCGEYYNGNDEARRGVAQCIGVIDELPSAQPERKTGRWLQISPAGIYECSECAQMVMTDDISCYKYCHGCGARMGGTEGD